MANYLLVVKGSPEEALASAARHGVVVEAMKAPPGEDASAKFHEVWFLAREADHNTLAGWFNEDFDTNEPPRAGGYPVGSLLYYKERDA